MKAFRLALVSLLSISAICSAQPVWDEASESCCWCEPEYVSVYGEGVFLNVEEENLPFALRTRVFEDFNATPNSFNFKDEEQHFGCLKTPGFRIGLGMTIPSTSWEGDLRWTHTSGTRYKNVQGSLTTAYPVAEFDFFVPILSPISTVALRAINGHWSVGFDSTQLTFGRSCDLSECTKILPFGGIKIDRIGQKVRFYGTKDVKVLPTDALVTTSIHLNSVYEGGGIVFGSRANVSLGCGLGLYSELAAGLTYGYYQVSANQQSTATDVDVPQTLRDHIKTSDHTGRGNIDFALGADWQCNLEFCNAPIELLLRVGYEYHQYFNQNFFFSSVQGGISCGGDLVLQGVTCGGGISF